MALFARLRNILACTAALGAGLLHGKKALRNPHLPLSITRWASFNFAARLSAAAAAMLAITPTGNPNLRGITLGRLLEGNVHVVAQIGTFVDLWTATTTAALAKDVAEDIAEGICKATPRKASTTHIGINARMTILVIGSALLRIAEHLIGFFRLFEFSFGSRIIGITIRVMLHR